MRWGLVCVLLLASAPAAASEPAPGPSPAAADLKFTARVDRTEVDAGSSLTLTLTLEGHLQDAELQPIAFPAGFAVAAQSQASNVSVRRGVVTKALTLVYVLLPHEPGTFQLGPFEVRRGEQPAMTEAITVTVKKPVLPPGRPPQQRFTL